MKIHRRGFFAVLFAAPIVKAMPRPKPSGTLFNPAVDIAALWKKAGPFYFHPDAFRLSWPAIPAKVVDARINQAINEARSRI